MAWPTLAGARPPGKKVATIGYLGFSTPALEDARIGAFRDGLRALGYIEGRNVALEYRWAEGNRSALPELARRLVALKPSVIVAMSNEPIVALKLATQTIPIKPTPRFMQAASDGAATAFEDQCLRQVMRFETGDPRYLWITQEIYVAEGRLAGPSELEYAVYTLK